MRLLVIAPYQNPALHWGWILHEIVGDYRRKGQLEGVEVDIDEGHLLVSSSAVRDEEFLAEVSLGGIKKVRECFEKGKHDAIIISGALDPGFIGSRTVSRIPVVTCIHSSVHVASLTGERCSILMASAQGALMVRHVVERYGLSHKVAGVRYLGHTTTYQGGLLSKYKDSKEERYKNPEISKIVDDVTAQAIAAADKEHADTFILGCEPMLTYEDEVRRRLDASGYQEIQLIGSLSASIAMAKAMVEMKLVKSPRAYPGSTLKLKQEYY